MQLTPARPRLQRGLFFLALLCAGAASAAPYHPGSDGQVLERLPAGAPSGAARMARPQDAAAAVRLARGYVERSRRDGDPRFLGYAEGALRAWSNRTDPPPDVLLLRATLLQARHHFDAALRDLDTLDAQQPGNAQSLLTRATVLRVQGRYTQAAASCARLDGRASAFVTDLCLASVRSLAGELPAMAAALDAMEPDSRTQPLAVRAWYRAERADMAERLGRDDDALARYRQALAGGDADPLLRAAAADLLLRLDRPSEALQVTGEDPAADVLRLRAALALRALGRPRPDLEAALGDAYAAAHRRGEDIHLREEGRFALDALGDAPRALALASRNWAVQREPADALLLLRAARAAGRPAAAGAAREWLRGAGLQDARLP